MSNGTGNWEVTRKGLWHKQVDYFIKKENLLYTRDGCYDRVLHLAENKWVDIEFLLFRYEDALIKHHPGEVDWNRFSRSRDEARKIKFEEGQWNAMHEIMYGPSKFRFTSLKDMGDIEAALNSRH